MSSHQSNDISHVAWQTREEVDPTGKTTFFSNLCTLGDKCTSGREPTNLFGQGDPPMAIHKDCWILEHNVMDRNKDWTIPGSLRPSTRPESDDDTENRGETIEGAVSTGLPETEK